MAQPPHPPEGFPGYQGPPPPPTPLEPPLQAPAPPGHPNPQNVYQPPVSDAVPATVSPFPVPGQGDNNAGLQGPQQPGPVLQPVQQAAFPPPGHPDAEALPEDSRLHSRIRDFYKASDQRIAVERWLDFFTKDAVVEIGPRCAYHRPDLKNMREKGLWAGLASKRHWIKDNKIWKVSEQSFRRTTVVGDVVLESGEHIVLSGGLRKKLEPSGLVKEAAWLAHANWVETTKLRWTLDQQDMSRQLELLQQEKDEGKVSKSTDYSFRVVNAKLQKLAQEEEKGENKEWRMNLYHVRLVDDNPTIQAEWAGPIPPASMLL